MAYWDLLGKASGQSVAVLLGARGAPQRNNGRLAASTAPDPGIQPRMDVLGSPVLRIGQA
jgi:hypothetical protein